MSTRYGDPNEEDKEAFLRGLEGASRPEVSSLVAQCLDALAASDAVYPVESATADALFAASVSFRHACLEAVEAAGKAHLERRKRKKGIRVSDDDQEFSDQEALAYYAFERKNSLRGWFRAPYDLNQLLDLFPCLHLRNGYRMVAYQHRDRSGNGQAYKFAYPTHRRLPWVVPTLALHERMLHDMGIFDDLEGKWALLYRCYRLLASVVGVVIPPCRSLPSWFSRDVENFIEGDGTPASFFQASICLRTINELGRFWHNVYWGHHQLVTAASALPHEGWTWYEPEPTDWRPQVWRNGEGRWNLSFYTVDSINAELRFHYDTFGSGYALKTFSAAIADYPGACEV